MPIGKIFDLGAQGDGLTEYDGRKIFIPFVLPEEEIVYKTDGENRGIAEEILRPSSERAEPVCPYFGTCGGCALQHMKTTLYQEFKLKELKRVFHEEWDLPEFDSAIFIPAHTRQRVTFALVWNGPARWFGLNPRKSDKVLPVTVCPVLVPGLEKLIEPLRAFFSNKKLVMKPKRGTGDVSVLWTDTGADILITLPFEPDFSWRQAVADFALSVGAARISWRRSEREVPEPLIAAHKPALNMCGFVLNPPPGVFLQPSREGETALQDKVKEYAGSSKKIMDLFCGAGTFTLCLLEKGRKLVGMDNALEALKTLEAASAGRIKTEERDLFKVPVLTDEFDGYDAVVFDPPRAGAKSQCEQIAFSNVRKVIAVSCNPVSFVRDAEILMQGGYVLKRLTPIDQFVFSPHMELVALFEK